MLHTTLLTEASLRIILSRGQSHNEKSGTECSIKIRSLKTYKYLNVIFINFWAMNEPEYQLPKPPAMMSARSYKAKFVEPLIDRFKSLISTLFARYFKALDSYHRLNITNGNLYRENEKLAKVNEKLSQENENLRAENRDYKLLRKVFGHKQIYDLLDRAKLEKQSKQREKRFRNYKYER